MGRGEGGVNLYTEDFVRVDRKAWDTNLWKASLLDAIIAEFGSVEECVRLAKLYRELEKNVMECLTTGEHRSMSFGANPESEEGNGC